MTNEPQDNHSHLVKGIDLIKYHIDVSYFTIMRASEQGRIPCYHVGRSVLFDPTEVIEAIKSGALSNGVHGNKISPKLASEAE